MTLTCIKSTPQFLVKQFAGNFRLTRVYRLGPTYTKNLLPLSACERTPFQRVFCLLPNCNNIICTIFTFLNTTQHKQNILMEPGTQNFAPCRASQIQYCDHSRPIPVMVYAESSIMISVTVFHNLGKMQRYKHIKNRQSVNTRINSRQLLA